MSFSESEVAALLLLALALGAGGLWAWRRRAVGGWYPLVLALVWGAVAVDPYVVPGVSSAGAVAVLVLGGIGSILGLRHAHDVTVGATPR